MLFDTSWKGLIFMAKRVLLTLLFVSTIGLCWASRKSRFYEFTNYNPDLPKSSIIPADFVEPKGSARVQTWWHWINSNVSKEGIAKDLKALGDCNYGAAIIFNIASDVTKEGDLKFNSPAWFENFKYVLDEAKKNNIEIGLHNCDGWSEAGGPWITPELSMKKLTFSKVRVVGDGTAKDIKLPRPFAMRDHYKKPSTPPFYKDIAVFAYPAFRPTKVAIDGKIVGLKKSSADTASIPQNMKLAFDGDPNTFVEAKPVLNKKGERFFGIDIEFENPIEASSAYIGMKWNWKLPEGVFLAASDDGKTWRDICVPKFNVHELYVTFPSTTAKFWRIGKRINDKTSSLNMDFRLLEFELVPTGELPKNAPFVSGIRQKVALVRSNNSIVYDEIPVPSKAIIDPRKIVFLSSKMSEDGELEWNVPAGEWEIVRLGYTTNGVGVHPASPSGKGLESDKLSAKATDFHFDSYLSKMIDVAGEHAGKTFKYVETDSWECGVQNWTEGLDWKFEKYNGYDIKQWYPVLLGEVVDSKEATEKFAADWRSLLSRLVVKNFYGRMGKRARAKGLMYQTEPLGEVSLNNQIGIFKMADIPQHEIWQDYRNLKYVTVPKSTGRWNLANVASFFGKKMVTCESLTQIQGNWSDSPLVLKGKIDTIFLAGMNTIVFHSYTHQPDERVPGWQMEPWGSCINRKMPWFGIGREFFNYIGRTSYMLQQGKPIVNGLSLIPEEVPMLGTPQNAGQGFDSDRIDSDCVKNYLRVKNGKLVSSGRNVYDYIEIPSASYVFKADTLVALKRLVENGAVLRGDKLKVHRSNISGDEAKWKKLNDELFGDGSKQILKIGKGRVYVGYNAKELVKELGLKPSYKFEKQDRAENIAVRARQHKDGSRWYYIVNCDSAQSDKFFNISFNVTGMVPELWNPENGKIEEIVTYIEKDGYTTVTMRLLRNDSMFIVFRKKSEFASITKIVSGGKLVFPRLPSGAAELLDKYSFSEDGALNIESVWEHKIYFELSNGNKMTLDTGKVRESIEPKKPFVVEFQEKYGAPKSVEFDNFISWTKHSDERVKNYSGVGTYKLKFDIPKWSEGEHAYLDFIKVMELGRVFVNGKLAGTVWKAPYIVDITKFVKEGENSVDIEVGNTWVNRCLYDATLPPEKRITWANTMKFHYPTKGENALNTLNADRSWKQGAIESGIIGDVRVLFTKDVSFAFMMKINGNDTEKSILSN